jgi:hypothetical protein
MNDTNTFIKPLNDSSVVFIVGGPTVTFNENVTVYSYPKQTIVLESKNNQNNENTKVESEDIKNTQIQTVKTRNIFKKLLNKISSFRI